MVGKRKNRRFTIAIVQS